MDHGETKFLTVSWMATAFFDVYVTSNQKYRDVRSFRIRTNCYGFHRLFSTGIRSSTLKPDLFTDALRKILIKKERVVNRHISKID